MRSVKAVGAGLAVHPSSVLGAVQTHTPAYKLPQRVHAHLEVGHRLVVVAVFRFVVAVTF